LLEFKEYHIGLRRMVLNQINGQSFLEEAVKK